MKQILVVDNDRIMLGIMKRFLEKKGYRVITVENGINALEVLESWTPDAIFIDLVMPNIDGKKLCQIIRGMKKFSDTYLIILSAISAEEWVDISNLGANACIAKGPFDEMSRHITEVLDYPEAVAERCLSGEILGVKSVYSRGITQELLSVKKHFEIILGAMSDGIVEINFERKIVYANPSFLSMIDIPEYKLLGTHLLDSFSKQERSRVIDLLEKRGQPVKEQTEKFPLQLNRRYITLDILHLDEDPPKDLLIIHDVSERKKHERTLRESERKYRQIFNIAPAGIYEVDYRTGKIASVNDAICEYSGYSKQELLSMNAIDLLTEDSQQRFMGRMEKVFKGERIPDTVEYSAYKKDGSEFLLSLNMRFVYDEREVVGATVVAHDISERRQSEMLLRQSEERYRGLFESISDLIFTMDLSGRFISVNPAVAKTLGYGKNEIIGRLPSDFMKSELRSLFETNFLTPIKNQGGSEGISSYKTKNGDKIYIEHHCTLVSPEKGAPYISGTGRNVTEKVLSEKEINKLQNHLHQSQKMEAIGTLAGGVAHDLNNLLAPILGYSEMLLDDFGPTDARRKKVHEITNAGTRARDLVRQLLAFSRKQALKYKPVNLNNAIIEFQNLLRGTIREDIEFDIILSPAVLTVMADIGQIEQVIMNLVVNAVAAMPEGGKLTIETTAVELDEKYIARHEAVFAGKYVLLAVSDTGCGMDDETLLHLFEPFYTTKGAYGTGLGLSTAYGIIKQHNGYIWAYSEPGQGSTFKVYLPISEEWQPQSKETQGETLNLHGSETVLLVEDDDQVRQLAYDTLNRQGYKILTADSGAEALKVLGAHDGPVHLLLTDVVMPGMNGKELFTKAVADYPELKVLYMSGYTNNIIAHRGVITEGIQFIEKPFTLNGLSAKVREVLESE